MSQQSQFSGRRQAFTEPTQLENKQDRRRGAGGRAAALRRVPSDSDCSGETASLSADSGERAVRPVLPPTLRRNKRSRRRGSEWEVLEGLKDGQRFEKRPEVFNGFLHKKRKWPLKGWHKRFFVVDGGILVYARSPTDVARGRLHGSVDVGLSVISAKARRRRIDIDADEFIYHLRAKTHDVFRTWLSVLKAHRLYRQHLLTFGARESVPKISIPLEDLAPTDASSRSTSYEAFSSSSSSDVSYVPKKLVSTINTHNISCKDHYLINKWTEHSRDSSCLMPLSFESLGNVTNENIQKVFNTHNSLCSMKCIKRYNISEKNILKRILSPVSDKEKQMIATDLNKNTEYLNRILKNPYVPGFNLCDSSNIIQNKFVEQPSCKKKLLSTNAYYFFPKKKSIDKHFDRLSLMKKSRKCTNVVKYRNVVSEPPMKKPSSKCSLLKDRSRNLKYSSNIRYIDSIKKKFQDNAVQVVMNKKVSKDSQDVMSVTDYDNVTDKLFRYVLQETLSLNTTNNESKMKFYIDQVVRELYDVNIFSKSSNPVKCLFKSLLEYWLKNSSVQHIKGITQKAKYTEKPSNSFFTDDKMISSVYLNTNINKATQFHGISNLKCDYGLSKNTVILDPHKKENNKATDSDKKLKSISYEKDRKIQEFEKLLNSTVYICDTSRRNESTDQDIKITKTLIENLGKINKSNSGNSSETLSGNGNSSNEIPKIQETINHLISDTPLSPDIAKEFFHAYLDVLLQNSNTNLSKSTSVSSKSVFSLSSESNCEKLCDVQTEIVNKKVSRCVSTYSYQDISTENNNDNVETATDSGQLYLKVILDRITTIFSKVTKLDHQIESVNTDTFKKKGNKNFTTYPAKNILYKNIVDNSLEFDLSKYELQNISTSKDPIAKGLLSLTLNLKQKIFDIMDCKPKNPKIIILNEHKKSFDTIKNDNTRRQHNSEKSNANKISHPFLRESKSSISDQRIDYPNFKDSKHKLNSTVCDSNYYNNKKEKFNKLSCAHSCYVLSNIKKSCLCSALSKKRNLVHKNTEETVIESSIPRSLVNPACINSNDNISTLDENLNSNIINETFILLLMENLCLLSKNTPSLNKEINALYVKLRKKHEKTLKNAECSKGLGLLGKIYDDNCCKVTKDNESQYIDVDPNTPTRDVKEVAVNTSNSFLSTQLIFVDANLSTPSMSNNVRHIGIQTGEIIPYEKSYPTLLIINNNSNEIMSSTQTESLEEFKISLTDRAISNPNWYRKILKKDCSMSTVIKCVLNNDGSQNFRFTTSNVIPTTSIVKEQEIINIKRSKKEKIQSPKLRQDIIKEITMLAPSFKVSTLSQTEKLVMKPWNSNIRREYRIHQLFLSKRYSVTKSSSLSVSILNENKNSEDLKTLYRCSSEPSNTSSGLVSPTAAVRGPQAGFVSGTPGGRLASWIIESGGPLETASRELGQAQLSVQQLQKLLDALELQQQVHHDTDVSLEGASPNVKKDRRKFGLRKKKSNSKCASVELVLPQHIDPSNSHMALSTLTAPPSPGAGSSSVPNSASSLPIACAAARPQSLPGAESLGPTTGPASISSLTPDHQLREDFTVLAKDLVANLKTVVSTLVCERGRLRTAMESNEASSPPSVAVVTALRTNLTSALQQNNELRSRLSRIHDASDLVEISSVGANSDPAHRQSLSYSSSCVSASEFFDAEEHTEKEIIAGDEGGVIELDGDSSSDAGSLSSEEGGSASSDNSDGASVVSAGRQTDTNGMGNATVGWNRRTVLPRPRPTPGGPSLWNLLYKNIGKDLSQVSMPVTINEPLNMLQRLCEELEYSDLMDSASDCTNAIERMALVSAFAVSAYAGSARRAASKPFNPLLGETYECSRPDRGFRFLAEQVSHHPPISACHAESTKWKFWQEARIKTKFWGKSMEFQPTGRAHVKLLTSGDHYSWNKVTTCVHNLFGGQRWVDQYGDMHIICHGTTISCKLNFIKASSWSSSRHEVRGSITQDGVTKLRLHGRWSEVLCAGDHPNTKCLWRPGAMPPENELYYGFTRFAMELNELEPGMKEALPHTDTRFRPDQRALEEGDVNSAEQFKHSVEQTQRERRRDSSDHNPQWFKKVSEDGDEMWVFSGEYWKAREAGFPHLNAPKLW